MDKTAPFNIEKDISEKMRLIKLKCRKNEYDKDKADLLFSEVLERIWIYRHKFTGTSNDFDKWVSVIIYHCVVNEHRNEKKLQKQSLNLVEEPDFFFGHMDPDRDFDYKETLKNVVDIVHENFKPKHFNVFKMMFIDGFNDKEIAEKLNIPPSTIRVIIFKIRNYLNTYKTLNAA